MFEKGKDLKKKKYLEHRNQCQVSGGLASLANIPKRIYFINILNIGKNVKGASRRVMD